jgi:hypothetical protein
VKKQKLNNMKKIIFACLLFCAFGIHSQKQAEISLELLDGNLVKGTTSMSDIEFVTAYGKLLIPINKVSHVEVGVGRDASSGEKAKGFLKILSTTTNDDTRKAAYTDLIKLGVKSIWAIDDFNNDPKNMSEENSYTGEFTIDNALNEILAANNLSAGAAVEDILTIDNNYTMGGAYNFSKIEVKTEYGNLVVPKEKIKTFDVSVPSDAGKGEYAYKLLATKHISGNTNGGWFKTGITLKTGQKFSINATGEVTLASLSNNKYKPDGSSKAESATEYTKPYGGGGEGEYDGGSSSAYPTYGQVVYKIGETATENLKAGAKFSGTAKKSGMLMISIYETVFNAANKGGYSVKVMLGK